MKFQYLTFGRWDKICITVMLVYRHWVIVAYNEKFSDVNVKCIPQKSNIEIKGP